MGHGNYRAFAQFLLYSTVAAWQAVGLLVAHAVHLAAAAAAHEVVRTGPRSQVRVTEGLQILILVNRARLCWESRPKQRLAPLVSQRSAPRLHVCLMARSVRQWRITGRTMLWLPTGDGVQLCSTADARAAPQALKARAAQCVEQCNSRRPLRARPPFNAHPNEAPFHPARRLWVWTQACAAARLRPTP